MLDPQTTNPPNTTNHQPFWGMPSLEKGPLTTLQMHTFGHTHTEPAVVKNCRTLSSRAEHPFNKGMPKFYTCTLCKRAQTLSTRVCLNSIPAPLRAQSMQHTTLSTRVQFFHTAHNPFNKGKCTTTLQLFHAVHSPQPFQKGQVLLCPGLIQLSPQVDGFLLGQMVLEKPSLNFCKISLYFARLFSVHSTRKPEWTSSTRSMGSSKVSSPRFFGGGGHPDFYPLLSVF